MYVDEGRIALIEIWQEDGTNCLTPNSKMGFLHFLYNLQGVNSLHKKKIQNHYVWMDKNVSAIYEVPRGINSLQCTS